MRLVPPPASPYDLPPHASIPTFLYTTQTWFYYALIAVGNGGVLRLWAATEFNPVSNVDSSNPLLLYQTIHRAVVMNDVNSPKLRDLRAALISLANSVLGPGALIAGRVRSLPVQHFESAVLRIDLHAVSTRLAVSTEDLLFRAHGDALSSIAPGASLQPDEYLLANVRLDECDVLFGW